MCQTAGGETRDHVTDASGRQRSWEVLKMTLRKVNCQTAFHIQLVEVHHCRRVPPTEESFWPEASQHTLG